MTNKTKPVEMKRKHSIQTKVTLTKQNIIDKAIEEAGLNPDDVVVINDPSEVIVQFGSGELIAVEEKVKVKVK